MDKQFEDDAPTCNLYHGPMARVHNELQHAGYGNKDSSITVQQLNKFDMMHYRGQEPLDEAAELFSITKDMRVLDIGSGFGGPARYLADKTGCHVTAMDIQQELTDGCTQLNSRCGVSSHVTAVCGDICDPKVLGALVEGGGYDVVMSLLVFLHVPDRSELFKNIAKTMKPGARLFIEDYYRVGDLSPEDAATLASVVGCPSLPTRETYTRELQEAGITIDAWEDQKDSWLPWTKERAQDFDNSYSRQVKVHGENTAKVMQEFYQAIPRLFTGNLSGAKIIGTKTA